MYFQVLSIVSECPRTGDEEVNGQWSTQGCTAGQGQALNWNLGRFPVYSFHPPTQKIEVREVTWQSTIWDKARDQTVEKNSLITFSPLERSLENLTCQSKENGDHRRKGSWYLLRIYRERMLYHILYIQYPLHTLPNLTFIKHYFNSTVEKTDAQRIQQFLLATTLISRLKYKQVY